MISLIPPPQPAVGTSDSAGWKECVPAIPKVNIFISYNCVMVGQFLRQIDLDCVPLPTNANLAYEPLSRLICPASGYVALPCGYSYSFCKIHN